MLIFHLQSRIWEFIFPFTCNRYGKCFGLSVTHLTSILEIHGSSPGVSNNICLHFNFWPFTVPSPLSIKTRSIANNVINNPFYFIITLFHLIHYFLRLIPMGDDFFSNLDSTFLCFEQYRRYFCLDFVDFEYVVAETSFHEIYVDYLTLSWRYHSQKFNHRWHVNYHI